MAAAVIKARQQAQQASKASEIASRASNKEEEGLNAAQRLRPDESWTLARKTLFGIITGHKFEAFCGVVILFNMFLVILETDASADEGEPARWLAHVTYCLLAFYSCELAVKMYVFRFTFFFEPWNVLDLCIVGVDVILLIMGFIISNMPSVAVLRVFRLVRLARAFKAAKQFNELHALIRSFGFAMKAIFWGILMIIMILTIWSILAVQLLHPINRRLVERNPDLYEGCIRCPSAFASTFESMLTFFQHVVAGDSWGNVSLPIIREEPWTCVFFLMVLVTVNLTMLNLILAVIVEAGAKATEEDMHEHAVQAQKKIKHAESRLIELCSTLDVDASGSLNIDEFLSGYAGNKEFADCLQTMNVTQSDIHMIFNICDEDGSGDVNYVEFVEQLRRIRRQGEQMLLYYVTEIRHKVQQMKLKLVDHVSGKLEELADFGSGDENAKLELQDEGPAADAQSNVPEVAPKSEEKQQDRSLGATPNGGLTLSEQISMQQEAKSFSEPKARERDFTAASLLEMSPLRQRGLLAEPKAPSPPTFSVPHEMVPLGNDPSGNTMASSSSTEIPSDIRGVVIGGALPGNATLGGNQLEKLFQINRDIAAVMQDVVSQSKLHTGLLNTLAAEVPVLKDAAGFPRQPSATNRCCTPPLLRQTVHVV